MCQKRVRAGFTLVELMMVIAIIGVLVGLALVVLPPIMAKGPEAQTANDIRQLEVAATTFKTRFKIWPPSRIRLKPNATDYNPADPVDVESLSYIQQLWPRIGNFTGLSWDGSGNPVTVELQADQCLVFFLGGPGGLQGFSTNPTNPVSPAGDRVGPFFNFEAGRLMDRVGNNFPSYIDPWGKKVPYLYFSSGKTRNGYQLAHQTLGVVPYFQSPTPANPTAPALFLNPDSVQIISAGQDGLFGQNVVAPPFSGVWRPATAEADAGPDGFDNQVNFSGSKLGVTP